MSYSPRPIATITDEMITDLTGRSELSEITNVSNTSVTFNLLEMFATEVYLLESLLSQTFIDIETRANEIPVGTLKWYAAETLKYQHGYTLTIVDGIPAYSIIDESAMAVKLSAAVEVSGLLLIKTAKLDGNNKAIKLSALELSGVQEYWSKKRFAGTALSVISVDGDEMKITARVEVDGGKITIDGQSIANPGTYPVEEAITIYLQELDFNGRFLNMSLIDAIQNVDGVKNVVINDCQAKQSGGSYFNVLQSLSQDYNSYAGYIIEDQTTPFRGTITYVI